MKLLKPLPLCLKVLKAMIVLMIVLDTDDAFNVDTSSDDMTSTDDTPAVPMGAEEQQNINGEASPDEKRKKVKYFQELEKDLGVIEDL